MMKMGKNYEISINIPKLKIVENDYRKDFISNISEIDDFFEKVTTKYPNVILDIFETKLEKNDDRLPLLDDEYFRLCEEQKYLKFIEEVFEINSNKCYVNIPFYDTNINYILQTLNNLDLIDKYIFLNQELNFKNKNNQYFLIDNINLLRTFLKAMIREVIKIDLYFDKKPLLLFSNFDLSLPLVFKTTKDMSMYKKVSNNHGLYFR